MLRSTGAVAFLVTAPVASAQSDGASLAVRTDSVTHTFWDAARAPLRWRASHPVLDDAVRWKPTTTAGIEWSELSLQGAGEARYTRVVLVRVDPARARFTLDQRTRDARPDWSVRDAPHDAVVALNAGQFTGALPWGWLVQRGSEHLAPGRGPMSSAFLVRTDGGIEWIDGDRLESHRARRDIALAFQSYPALLTADGDVPPLLHTDPASAPRSRPAREADVDRAHRDARLALGIDRQGRVLIALTRFDALGDALSRLPFGLTVPEMSALMGALGARQAMLLDGGISAQLLIATKDGLKTWSGTRKVPLALVIRAK